MSSRAIALALCLCPLAALGQVSIARAADDEVDGSKDAAKARAAALVDAGNQLFGEGRFDAALEKYLAAHVEYGSPKILFNIAEAENELGAVDESIAHYEQFLSEAPVEESSPLAERARTRLEALRRRSAYIEIGGAHAGAAVAIDGDVVGTLPLDPVRVAPGAHRIAVTAAGYERLELDARAEPGETSRLDVKLTPLVVVRAPIEPGEEPVTSTWWFWTAIGAAALVGGAAIAIAASSGGDDFVPGGELGTTSTADWMKL